MGKEIIFGTQARSEMQAGLDILANAVKVTLGPRGRHAAIERDVGPPLVTKDGVTVANAITLDDPIKNMGSQLVRYVASATNGKAGDGTTTATVLAQAIYSEGSKMVEAGYNPVLIKRGIDTAVEAVTLALNKISIDVSSLDVIKNVAIISSNNDLKIGELIAETVESIGSDGLIYVEDGTGSSTSVEYTDGFQIPRGYVSQGFVNNNQKMTAEFENPLILCYDGKIEQTGEIVPLLEEVSESGRPLLIVGKSFSDEVVQTLVLNKMRGSLSSCAIKSPGFGDIGSEVLADIAVACGTTIFDPITHRLSSCTVDDLGGARKVIASHMTTSIIDGAGTDESLQDRIDGLRSQLDETRDHHMIVSIKQRLSSLSGGVALIKVGGSSDTEVQEKKARIEDSINAVKAAISEGVVPGGGAALVHISNSLDHTSIKETMNEEEVIGFSIVKRSILAPFKQILANAGVEHFEWLSKTKSVGSPSGYDALNNEFVPDMIERGIIDPVKVVRTALEHAASASGTLLTTEVSIFNTIHKD